VPFTPEEASVVCTHERRPGTTVCLRCRHDARIAARDRIRRLTFRGLAATIVAATVITAATLGGTAIRGRNAGKQSSASAPAAAGVIVAPGTDSLAADSAARGTRARPDTTSPTATTVIPTRAPAPIAPIVRIGESPLRDGITANRTDSGVVVSFDIQLTRTRRAEKFEQIVRTTLPAIYGPVADSALARIPEGGLARQGDLLSELPTRGVRIPLTPPWEIRVYPETRSGSGGPLVVRYRATLVSSGA
jgi:hypothetical protein